MGILQMRHLRLGDQERSCQLETEGRRTESQWGMSWAMLILEWYASFEGHLCMGQTVDEDHQLALVFKGRPTQLPGLPACSGQLQGNQPNLEFSKQHVLVAEVLQAPQASLTRPILQDPSERDAGVPGRLLAQAAPPCSRPTTAGHVL